MLCMALAAAGFPTLAAVSQLSSAFSNRPKRLANGHLSRSSEAASVASIEFAQQKQENQISCRPSLHKMWT